MSEQALILIAIVVVAIVALVVVLAIVALARREASKNIHVGDINVTNTSASVSIGPSAKAAPVQSVQTRNTVKEGIKVHLYLFTFVSPSFVITGIILWWLNSSLAVISNLLTWAAATLLIPALYGELHRPASVVNRIVLILDGAFLILLSVTILAPQFMTVEVVMGMSLAVIGFAIAARGHKTSA